MKLVIGFVSEKDEPIKDACTVCWHKFVKHIKIESLLEIDTK